MNKTNLILIAIVAVLCLIGIGACSTYNSLTGIDEEVNKTWADVENYYQRRADLIPNLVNTVKGYSEHESKTLENVTAARAGLTEAYNAAKETKATDGSETQVAAYQQAQDKLQSALGIYVNAVREAYPELKANTNFLDLQAQLEGTENRIATARNRYNTAVQEYNTRIRRFPTNMLAGMCGFERRAPFKAEEGAQKAPKVEF